MWLEWLVRMVGQDGQVEELETVCREVGNGDAFVLASYLWIVVQLEGVMRSRNLCTKTSM